MSKFFLSKLRRNTFVSILALSILVLASPLAVSATTATNHASVPTAYFTGTAPISNVKGDHITSNLANSKVKTLCPSIPNGDEVSGIYPGKGGAFVEDWSTGNLIWCAKGASKTIESAPSGGSSGGYFGMAGMMTSSKGLVLVLSTWGLGGIWFCYGASTSGCKTQSAFIAYPSSFCSTLATGSCLPEGVALDKSLNVYWVDSSNIVLVECTAASKYTKCSVLPGSSAFSGYQPVDVALVGKTFYVSDLSCTGNVWTGTAKSLKVLTTVGDSLEGITISTSNVGHKSELYVADSGACTSTDGHVVDLTDHGKIPTPFTSSNYCPGLDSELQMGSFTSEAAYQTNDPS